MPVPGDAPMPGTTGAGVETPLVIHGSCVAHAGVAVVITGASGSGKSTLALELMSRGATLVADDRTCLWRDGGRILADAPDTIRGRVEARFVGILNASAHGPAPLAMWVDMDRTETRRLPPLRQRACLGLSIPLLHNAGTGGFPAAILQYLTAGRNE